MSIKILNDEKVINLETLQKMIREVGVPANLNISYCYINKKDWSNAVPHLDRVIEFDKYHVKALYRRCLAYINLNKLEQADEDLIVLENLIGGSKELEELEELYEKKQGEKKIDEKTIYSRMFKQYVNGK
jgi:hypothetical protein